MGEPTAKGSKSLRCDDRLPARIEGLPTSRQFNIGVGFFLNHILTALANLWLAKGFAAEDSMWKLENDKTVLVQLGFAAEVGYQKNGDVSERS